MTTALRPGEITHAKLLFQFGNAARLVNVVEVCKTLSLFLGREIGHKQFCANFFGSNFGFFQTHIIGLAIARKGVIIVCADGQLDTGKSLAQILGNMDKIAGIKATATGFPLAICRLAPVA